MQWCRPYCDCWINLHNVNCSLARVSILDGLNRGIIYVYVCVRFRERSRACALSRSVCASVCLKMQYHVCTITCVHPVCLCVCMCVCAHVCVCVYVCVRERERNKACPNSAASKLVALGEESKTIAHAAFHHEFRSPVLPVWALEMCNRTFDTPACLTSHGPVTSQWQTFINTLSTLFTSWISWCIFQTCFFCYLKVRGNPHKTQVHV